MVVGKGENDKGDFMSRSRSLYCHSDTGPTGPTALILRDQIRSSLSRPFIPVLPSRPFILVRDCFQDYLVAFENASEITLLRSKRRVSEFFAKCRWKRTVDRRHDDRPFIVLTETKSSYRHIPVWARYSPHRTRVEAHANLLSP